VDKETTNEESKDEPEEPSFSFAKWPSTITGKILEMEPVAQHNATMNEQLRFLGHLPPASSYLLVEIDLATSTPTASKDALSKYNKQLKQRASARA